MHTFRTSACSIPHTEHKAKALHDFVAVHQAHLGSRHNRHRCPLPAPFQIRHRLEHTDPILAFLEAHDIEEPVLDGMCRLKGSKQSRNSASSTVSALMRWPALSPLPPAACHLLAPSLDSSSLPQATAADSVEVPPEEIVAQRLKTERDLAESSGSRARAARALMVMLPLSSAGATRLPAGGHSHHFGRSLSKAQLGHRSVSSSSYSQIHAVHRRVSGICLARGCWRCWHAHQPTLYLAFDRESRAGSPPPQAARPSP